MAGCSSTMSEEKPTGLQSAWDGWHRIRKCRLVHLLDLKLQESIISRLLLLFCALAIISHTFCQFPRFLCQQGSFRQIFRPSFWTPSLGDHSHLLYVRMDNKALTSVSQQSLCNISQQASLWITKQVVSGKDQWSVIQSF